MQIHSKFLQETNEREVISHKIIENNFIPVLRNNNDSGVLDVLSLDYGLQVFRPLLGDKSTRIFSEFKLDDGRPIVKHTKKYFSDGQELVVGLSAQNLTEALKGIGEEVIAAVEKNTNCRVMGLKLIFIQDIDRKLWLMGSSSCTVYEKPFIRSSTPVRPHEKLTLDSSQTVSSLKHPKKALFPLSKCNGDFCEYYLERPQSSNNPEDEFEEILSKFTLSYNSTDPHKYKQEVTSNFIEKEYEKIRLQKLTHKIAFRYILIGKNLLLSKPKAKTLTFFPEEIQKIEEPEYRFTDKPPIALAHPSRLYDEAKICENCYNVYNLIRILKVKTKNQTSLPKISRDIPSYYNIEQDDHFIQEHKKIGKFDKMKYGMLYTLTTNPKEHNIDLTTEDFPAKITTNQYLNNWGVKTQHQKNNESWQKYISTLKRKSVLRNRLKSSTVNKAV